MLASLDRSCLDFAHLPCLLAPSPLSAFYIAYGDYGARRPKSSSYETWIVMQGIVAGVLATGIIWNFFRYIGAACSSGRLAPSTPFPTRWLTENAFVMVAPPPPRSMTLEWQEATNEQLKEMNVSSLASCLCLAPGFAGR